MFGIFALLTGLMIIFDERATRDKIRDNHSESQKRCAEWQRNFDELEKLRNKRY